MTPPVPPLERVREDATVWHANEIFRRDWSVDGGVAKGKIVEWKRGDQLSSRHSEAFIDVVLHAEHSALVSQLRARLADAEAFLAANNRENKTLMEINVMLRGFAYWAQHSGAIESVLQKNAANVLAEANRLECAALATADEKKGEG